MKLLLLGIAAIFSYAITQPITATYAGSQFTGTGTFTHTVNITVTQTTDIMLECDGYVSYYSVNQGTTPVTVEFNGGKGSPQKRIKITTLNTQSSPIILIIKSIIMT